MRAAWLGVLVATGCSSPAGETDPVYDFSGVVVDLAGGSSPTDVDAGGAGSCSAPRDITIGFHETGTTVGYPASSATCASAGSLPAVLYRFTVALGDKITIDADDSDGATISWALHDGNCETGTTICSAPGSGHDNDSGIQFELPETWLLVLTRDTPGPYSFALLAD